MLDSGIEVRLNDRKIPIAGGTVVAIPAGTIHEVTNASNAKARSIIFTNPGGLELFFAGLNDLVQSGAQRCEFADLFERTGTKFPQGSSSQSI